MRSSRENIPDRGTAGTRALRLQLAWCVHRTAGGQRGWGEGGEGSGVGGRGRTQRSEEGVGGFGGVPKGFTVLAVTLTFAPVEWELWEGTASLTKDGISLVPSSVFFPQ